MLIGLLTAAGSQAASSVEALAGLVCLLGSLGPLVPLVVIIVAGFVHLLWGNTVVVAADGEIRRFATPLPSPAMRYRWSWSGGIPTATLSRLRVVERYEDVFGTYGQFFSVVGSTPADPNQRLMTFQSQANAQAAARALAEFLRQEVGFEHPSPVVAPLTPPHGIRRAESSDGERVSFSPAYVLPGAGLSLVGGILFPMVILGNLSSGAWMFDVGTPSHPLDPQSGWWLFGGALVTGLVWVQAWSLSIRTRLPTLLLSPSGLSCRRLGFRANFPWSEVVWVDLAGSASASTVVVRQENGAVIGVSPRLPQADAAWLATYLRQRSGLPTQKETAGDPAVSEMIT